MGQVTATPVSRQVGVVPHCIDPTLHGFAVGTQVAPSVQTWQVPPTQTLVEVVPQTVASGWNAVSVHTGAPVVHEMEDAVAQGFVDVQVAPGVHDVQVPAVLQTPLVVPVVQEVPAATNVWSLHAAVPVEQSMVAVAAQTLVDVQVAPCEHEMQAPA